MKENRRYRLFYIFSVLGILIASSYPLYMGIKVISDMGRNGAVYSGDYPKYIIPYTPISISVIILASGALCSVILSFINNSK